MIGCAFVARAAALFTSFCEDRALLRNLSEGEKS
jgi:hypothetical protein